MSEPLRVIDREYAAPKRMTLSEVVGLLLARQTTHRVPSIGLKRSAAPASKGLTEITCEFPVCAEFPTAQEAIDAATRAYDTLRMRYPLPSGFVGAEGEPAEVKAK